MSVYAAHKSTHLDLVQIGECVPDVERAEAAVPPRLLLPGGGGALRGDVVRYGGRWGGGGEYKGGSCGGEYNGGVEVNEKWSWGRVVAGANPPANDRGNFTVFVSTSPCVTTFP